MKHFKYACMLLILWNLITFIFMGIDKEKAKKGAWRISEKTLLCCSFLMGAVGCGAGMLVFHHKTQKRKFRLMIPSALVENALVVGISLWWITK